MEVDQGSPAIENHQSAAAGPSSGGSKVSSKGKRKDGQSQAQDHINWVYINGLGEKQIENVTESDILTAITFDKSG